VLTEQAEFVRDAAKRFVEKECNEWRCREWDADEHYPKEVFDQIAALGWYGIGIPEADGGTGGGALELLVVSEELGRDITGVYEIGRHSGRDSLLRDV
jgi:alkylation response protein AidB-like acyl-CoA dehydrogenase